MYNLDISTNLYRIQRKYSLLILSHIRLIMVLQVIIQVTALLKSLLADNTLERRHIRVSPHVLLQVHGLYKCFPADDTPVWFHFRVCS